MLDFGQHLDSPLLTLTANSYPRSYFCPFPVKFYQDIYTHLINFPTKPLGKEQHVEFQHTTLSRRASVKTHQIEASRQKIEEEEQKREAATHTLVRTQCLLPFIVSQSC
jgi:hypothetical protein